MHPDQHWEVRRGRFPKLKTDRAVSWEDVILKTCQDHSTGHITGVLDKKHLPTFVVTSDFRPGSLQQAFNYCDLGSRMDVYYSYGNKCLTYGRLRDDCDVWIVQAYGIMTYESDIDTVTLEVGDCLYIPFGTWHNPISSGPRITLSFSK